MNSLFIKRIKTNALTRGFIAMRILGRTPPPKTVIWECTLDCTMDCLHCGSGGKTTTGTELSTEEISAVIQDLSQMGVRRFLVTGGEPLLRPDILDVLQYAQECGLETGFSTNGSCISEENVGRIVTVADSIQVSVDGVADTHDQLRGSRGAFAGAMNALQLLGAHKCRQTCMTSIISPYNFPELEELYSLAKENADLFRVGTVMPIGKATDNDSLFLSDSQLQSLADFFVVKKKNKFPILVGENLGWLGEEYDNKILQQDFFYCGAGILSCCVGADGRIRGCPELPPAEEFIAGDLRQDRFRTVWETGFSQYRDQEISRLPPGCCRCPDIEVCRGGCRVMQLKGLHCTKDRLRPSCP